MNSAIINQKAPLIAALTLVTAAVGYASWRGVVIYREAAQPRPVVVSRSVTEPMNQTHTIAQILPLNIFGQEIEAAPVVEKSTEDLPETNLRLTLRGVSAATEDEKGGALIEGPDRNTDFFRIGEQMPGNVVLHSVFANRVVLDRNGALENLTFPDSFEDGGYVTVYDAGASQGYEEPAYSEPVYEEPYADPPVYNDSSVANDPAMGYEAPPPDDGASYEQAYQPPEEYVPEVSSDPAAAAQALEEQRKQEIRDRLQRLREQIRARTEG